MVINSSSEATDDKYGLIERLIGRGNEEKKNNRKNKGVGRFLGEHLKCS